MDRLNKLQPFVIIPSEDRISTLLVEACGNDCKDYLLPILSAKAGKEFRGFDLVNMLRDAFREYPGNQRVLVPKLIEVLAGGNPRFASFSIGLFSRNNTTP